MVPRPRRRIHDPSGDYPEGEELPPALRGRVSGVGEGDDVERYLGEELSALRRIGGFDALIAVAVKYDGERYELTIISDCDEGFTKRLERLGELMAEFVREVARDRPPP